MKQYFIKQISILIIYINKPINPKETAIKSTSLSGNGYIPVGEYANPKPTRDNIAL
jgi:hypothetical protein